MDHESKVLKGFNKAIANAYRLKTGMSESQLLGLMDKESWLTAQEAKEYGFIDEIIGDNEGVINTGTPSGVYNSFFGSCMIPKEKINALREKLREQPPIENSKGQDDEDEVEEETNTEASVEEQDTSETSNTEKLSDIAKIKNLKNSLL